MDRYTRWNALLHLLADSGRLTVEDAAAKLGVSPATVRRDFDGLAAARRIIRTRGAAVHGTPASADPAVLRGAAARHARPELRRMAVEAASLVRPGGVVGVTGTPVVRHVARAVAGRADGVGPQRSGEEQPARPDLGDRPPTTLVTNDLAIADELSGRPSLKLVLTGGVLAAGRPLLVGPLAGLLLQGISLDVVVLGATAVDPDFGVTAADETDADLGALMVSRARQVVAVADSGRLDHAAFARVCATERLDVLVTDRGLAPATAERFASRGVRVVTV